MSTKKILFPTDLTPSSEPAGVSSPVGGIRRGFKAKSAMAPASPIPVVCAAGIMHAAAGRGHRRRPARRRKKQTTPFAVKGH